MIPCGPLAGYLNDKFNFKTPLLVSTISMSILVYLMPSIPLGIPTVAIIAAWGIVGGPMMSGTIVSALISQTSPLNVRGMCLGLGNLMGFLGATVGPILFGYVADVKGFMRH